MRFALVTFCRFNDIGVNGTLCQELNAFALTRQFTCGICKHIDEGFANDFTFGFWIANASQCGQKTFLSIHANDFNAHVFSKDLHHLVAFMEP